MRDVSIYIIQHINLYGDLCSLDSLPFLRLRTDHIVRGLKLHSAPIKSLLYIAFFQDDIIKEPQRSVFKDSMNIGNYTYIKIKIYTTFDGRDFTIC